MNKTILVVLVSCMVLVGCTAKQSEGVVDSKVKISESANSTTENTDHEMTVDSSVSSEENYTLQSIRKMSEKFEDLDTIIPDLYDTPDDYGILAEQNYEENMYQFISGPADGEPVAYTESKEDSEKYNLAKNPDATSIKEVKQLIAELKQERMQNE